MSGAAKLSPWKAVALSPEAKEAKFRQVMNLAAEPPFSATR